MGFFNALRVLIVGVLWFRSQSLPGLSSTQIHLHVVKEKCTVGKNNS